MSLPILFSALLLLISLPFPTIASEPEGEYEWQLLSANNFSSQIHLHPHVLLLVTVPWCGETRSLMRGISKKLAKEQEKYSSLKLMLVYSNHDKELADSIGAVEGTTVLCYHHAVSYKYQGGFRVQDILSSVRYLVSHAPEELPLKRLGTSEELEMFLASTDKAVLLLDSCGWASKLLAHHTGNETLHGGLLPRELHKETNRTQASGRHTNLKDVDNEMMTCEAADGCDRNLWVGEFSAVNKTASSTNEDIQPMFGASCSFEEYKKFKSFFLEFIVAARDVYLPPQRQRYGLVSDRLLLSPIDVGVSDLWSLIISYAGCPGCITKLKEKNYLQDALKMHDLPVMELQDDGNGLGPALPVDKPSILLFVDRTSDFMETRKKSQEALLAFKELALEYWKSYRVDRRINDWPKRSLHTAKGSASMFGNHRLMLSSPSQKIKIKDKMSIVIINDGKHVTLDAEASSLQSSSLREILTRLLRQKKHSKLSSLAKEAGFQLLSDDVDIKLTRMLSSQVENQDQELANKSDEVSDNSRIDVNKDYSDSVAPIGEEQEQSQPTNIEFPYNDIVLGSKDYGFVDPPQSFSDLEVASSIPVDLNTEAFVEADKSEGLEHHFAGFNGSFFFCDGNFRFLKSLTNDSEVPSIVIIDPFSQQHFVFSEDVTSNISSISTFIDGFLNGSLIPYGHSGHLRETFEMPQPPFVNVDFHEKDSIPCVTTETFSELVFGSSQSDAQNSANAWNKDVLVLFSSSWCGFCQRMELVVREVHRALIGYANMVKSDSKYKELFSEADLKVVISELPLIYSIDCTLNECSWILKSVGQREVYPTLVLFPAEKKTAIRYDGNMMVTDIIKFIASHGISSQHLAKQKGTLWIEDEECDYHDGEFRDTLTSRNDKGAADAKDNHVGAILSDLKLQNHLMLKQTESTVPGDLVVGSFLVATDHLNGLNPFSEAMILIVSADHRLGVQGLVVNKPISWDYVLEFKDAEFLKEAPLYFGGPVIQEGVPLVSLTSNSSNHQYPQVLPGVYFFDQLATSNKIEEVKAGYKSATDSWFFWGYSAWSWDQLLNEIAVGAWKLHEGSNEDLRWP